jgi:hypothetical protein
MASFLVNMHNQRVANNNPTLETTNNTKSMQNCSFTNSRGAAIKGMRVVTLDGNGNVIPGSEGPCIPSVIGPNPGPNFATNRMNIRSPLT